MRLLKTEKQKDNLAKYLYDISKVVFTVAVIGPIAKPENVNKFALLFGLLASIIIFTLASIIDTIKFMNNE